MTKSIENQVLERLSRLGYDETFPKSMVKEAIRLTEKIVREDVEWSGFYDEGYHDGRRKLLAEIREKVEKMKIEAENIMNLSSKKQEYFYNGVIDATDKFLNILEDLKKT